MKLLVHVLTINRCLFKLHAINGFSIGVAMEHYWCFKIFIPSISRFLIADTIRWFPHGSLKLPTPSRDELLHSAIDDLCDTLQLSMKKISYHLKTPHPENPCLTLIPPSIIETYVILLSNLQCLPTSQVWKFNQRIPLDFQGWNFIQMIPLNIQGWNQRTLHLHHNQHFDDPTLFVTSQSL